MIISADIVTKRLSSVYSVEGKNLYAHKFKDDSRGVNSCDKMADNREHGLVSTENRKARPTTYRVSNKSLARPTSRCIFLMMRIFRFMLVLLYINIYLFINSTNFPPIMFVNRIHENQNLLSL